MKVQNIEFVVNPSLFDNGAKINASFICNSVYYDNNNKSQRAKFTAGPSPIFSQDSFVACLPPTTIGF